MDCRIVQHDKGAMCTSFLLHCMVVASAFPNSSVCSSANSFGRSSHLCIYTPVQPIIICHCIFIHHYHSWIRSICTSNSPQSSSSKLHVYHAYKQYKQHNYLSRTWYRVCSTLSRKMIAEPGVFRSFLQHPDGCRTVVHCRTNGFPDVPYFLGSCNFPGSFLVLYSHPSKGIRK
jgi:hypothetical protein